MQEITENKIEETIFEKYKSYAEKNKFDIKNIYSSDPSFEKFLEETIEKITTEKPLSDVKK